MVFRTLNEDKQHSMISGYQSAFIGCNYNEKGIAEPSGRLLSTSENFDKYDVVAERLGGSVVALDFDLRIDDRKLKEEGKESPILRDYQDEYEDGHGGTELRIDINKCLETLPGYVQILVEHSDAKITRKGIQIKIKTPEYFRAQASLAINDIWKLETCSGFFQGKKYRPVFMSGSRKLKGKGITHFSINELPAIDLKEIA